MRISTLAHFLLTFGCAACCAYLLWRDRPKPVFPETRLPEPESRAVSDVAAVRSFFGLNSLGGVVELPGDVKHWAVVVMKFEDGQYKGRLAAAAWSPPDGGPSSLPFSMVWGPDPAGKGVLVADVIGTRTESARKDDFMKTFDQADGSHPWGGISSSFAAVISTRSETMLGYQVFAYASSRRVRDGGHPGRSGDLKFEIENRKQVIACGVKPFTTRNDAMEWAIRDRDTQ